MQSRLQEQPTFEAGDRFLLRRPIEVLDITREHEDYDATFWAHLPAGLKGYIEEVDEWETDLDDGTTSFCFTLRLDDSPRKIFYIAEDDHGGPFEQVAAKSINLN